MTQSTATAVLTWRHFDVRVARLERLSPSFLRVTFTGEDLDEYADLGYDARTKLLFPVADGYQHLPRGEDWFLRWRDLPDEQRNTMRTYTTRAVRPGVREVDVDVVLHGDSGPASRWANRVQPGDPMVLMGPNAASDGPHGGVEFALPEAQRPILLAGDETAVPAIAVILEQLPAETTGAALLEVPEEGDQWPLRAPAGVTVTWLPREGRSHGEFLVPAVQEAAGAMADAGRTAATTGARVDLPEVDVDAEILWDLAVPEVGGDGELYAWFAGEAAVIRTLRRHLVRDLGVDRRSVSFMGYWRIGRSEN